MSRPGFRFEKGDAVEVDGVLYDVELRQVDGLQLRCLDAARTLRPMTHDEFWNLYHEKNENGVRRLVVRRGLRGNLPSPVVANLTRPLEDFDPRWQDEALMRLDYVQICARLFSPEKKNRRGRFPMNPRGFARAARLVSGIRRRRLVLLTGKSKSEIGLEKVGGSTLREWYWRWVRGACNVHALVPCHDEKGTIGTRLKPFVSEIVWRWIRELYLIEERPDLRPVYDVIVAEIEERNAGLIAPHRIPDYTTVLRLVNTYVTPYDMTRKREGARTAAQDFREARGPRNAPTRPLQVVEIDHTPMDILLLSDDGTESKGDRRKKTQRVSLTLARCKFTRMIVGIYISREKPSWTSVMACLRMAILEKNLDGLVVENPWPVIGVPEVIVVDNGPEFHSRSMTATCGQLRIEIKRAPRRKPRHKGMIERTIGDFQRGFLAFIPGKLFSNPQVRREYDSEHHAALSLKRLVELAIQYAVDMENGDPMDVLLGRTPLQVWNTHRGDGVRMPPCADDLDAALGLTIDRTVTAVGVTFLGLVYQSEELQAIRKRVGHMGKMLMVKVDPCDLGYVLVLDEGDGNKRKARWIRVPCEYPELADGVSVVEWKEIVSLARDETEEGRKVALSKLRRARKRFAEEMLKLRTPPKKVRSFDIDWSRANAASPWFDIEDDEDGGDVEGSAVRRRGRGRPKKGGEPAPAAPRRVGDDTPPPVDPGDDPVEEAVDDTPDEPETPNEKPRGSDAKAKRTVEKFRDPSTWDDD